MEYYRFNNVPLKLSQFEGLVIDDQNKIMSGLLKENQMLVSILAFVLMPNHFHFLIRQLVDEGIKKFISRITNSHSRYVNIKKNRVGPLFQGIFKSVLVESEEQLIHLSRYIHLNPVKSAIVRPDVLHGYLYSSFPAYINDQFLNFISTDTILKIFPSKSKYISFVLNNSDYEDTLNKIDNLAFDIK